MAGDGPAWSIYSSHFCVKCFFTRRPRRRCVAKNCHITHTRDEDGCDKYSFSFKERIVYDCITYIARRFHSDSRGGTPAEAFIFVFLFFHLCRARKNSRK
jgi:hypothetical protein